MGRPSSYKPEYCQKIIDFFNIEPNREITETITYANGAEKECYRLVANNLPFISAFARKIGVCHDTLLEWTKVHPKFSLAYKGAKALQKEMLIANGLQGLYPAAAYCFTAKNIAGMRDKQEIDHTIQGSLYVENEGKSNAELKAESDALAEKIIANRGGIGVPSQN